MVFDWLLEEGWIVFNWWVLVSLAGLAVLPLMFRLLGGLPDRGYTLARPAGILLTGFVFWLLASFGFLDNSSGSIAFAWVIVVVISALVYFRVDAQFDYRQWWRENRKLVIATELLFLILLVGWAIVKAHRNDIAATEKPMDLAFMSAINQSQSFPPNDPWLSDYSISYYYFGYLMASMLSMASGVSTTIGYNMHVAMLFALTGVATFGVVYNLVRSRAFGMVNGVRTVLEKASSQDVAILIGGIGAVFVILMGNFQLPFVELPYQTSNASESYLEFWDLQNRLEPLPQVSEFIDDDDPDTPEFEMVDRSGALESWNNWWWFRSARAIRDHNLTEAHNLQNPEEFDIDRHTHIEVIAEFPQFSFLLADSHPHVMALPYVLLAMGLALNLLLLNQTPDMVRVLFYGICIGALVFLNTWDAPIYIMLMVGADAVRRLRANQGQLQVFDWVQLLALGSALVGITIVAYFPFLVGFRSQLGGVIPNLIYPTKTQHLFLVFGPFFGLLATFLALEVWRARRNGRMNWSFSWQFILAIFGVLLLALFMFASMAWFNDSTRQAVLSYIDNGGGWDEILPIALERRLETILTPVLLLLAVGLIVGILFPKMRANSTKIDDQSTNTLYTSASGFAVLLIGAGVMLVLIPEFVYLRDNFATRMNTIFKFYYQSWLLFSVAGAYGIYAIVFDRQEHRPAPVLRYAYSGLLVATLALGLIFPIFGIYSRIEVEGGVARTADGGLTLDGGRTVAGVSAADYDVLQCFNQRITDDTVVLVEAVGNSYDNTGAGRTGALTGNPTVIGWQGHQSQWRGTSYGEIVASRPLDIERLYTDLRYDVVQEVITRYGIDYIMYGSTERIKYGDVGEEKFMENLTVFCESDPALGNSRIYQVNSEIAFNP